MANWMIICCMDRTLWSTPEAAIHFIHWLDEHRDRFYFVCNDALFADKTLWRAQTSGLINPDFVIGGLGTQVIAVRSAFPSHSVEKIEGWLEGLSEHFDADVIRSTLAGDSRLLPRPNYEQSAYKVTYNVAGHLPELAAEVQQRLVEKGQQVQAILSYDQYLDLVPKQSGKEGLALMLVEALGIPPERVIVAGDDGTDRALLTCGFRGVVIGNSSPEIDDLQGPTIYRAEANGAGGVMEGVMHWMEQDGV